MSVMLEHVARTVDGIPTIRDVSLTLERGTTLLNRRLHASVGGCERHSLVQDQQSGLVFRRLAGPRQYLVESLFERPGFRLARPHRSQSAP